MSIILTLLRMYLYGKSLPLRITQAACSCLPTPQAYAQHAVYMSLMLVASECTLYLQTCACIGTAICVSLTHASISIFVQIAMTEQSTLQATMQHRSHSDPPVRRLKFVKSLLLCMTPSQSVMIEPCHTRCISKAWEQGCVGCDCGR